jgi:hypothetical protein
MKILASLAVLAVAICGSASATIINYNTAGSTFTTIGGAAQGPGVIAFTRSSGASSYTISYANIIAGSSFDDAFPGTVISYGVFQDQYTNGVAPGTPGGAGDVVIAVPSFTLTVLLNTSKGNISFSGSSSGGNISQNSSNVMVTFSPAAFNIGIDAYTVNNPTGIPPSTSLGGQASIQGFASSTTVPEPGTMFLLGAGLIGVGFSARKKFLSRS